ncbi:MAG: ABC transporter ATP-binding protein [Acidimicrobiales bacterium]
MPVIEISDIGVRYGSVTAVDGLSLSVDGGQVLGLIGPNGAGKTTTVETLEGFRRPDRGQVRVLGLDPVTSHDQLMNRMGVMLQGCRLPSAIRPLEAVKLFASYHRTDIATRSSGSGSGSGSPSGSASRSGSMPADPVALLERVGLSSRSATAWRKLSGGEQQRLALALALVGQPSVIILDEPTAGLDVEGRLLVRSVIEELRADGVCVLITSHELDELARVADQLAIIATGRLLAHGTLAELVASGGGGDAIRFRCPGLDAPALATALAAPVEALPDHRFEVRLTPGPANMARLTTWLADHDLPLQDLQTGGPSLEEIYLRLTREPPAQQVIPSSPHPRSPDPTDPTSPDPTPPDRPDRPDPTRPHPTDPTPPDPTDPAESR